MRLLLVCDDPEVAGFVEQAAPPGVHLVACLSSREAVDLLQAGVAGQVDVTLVHLAPTAEPPLPPDPVATSASPSPSEHRAHGAVERRFAVLSAHWRSRQEARPTLIRFARVPFDSAPLLDFFRANAAGT